MREIWKLAIILGVFTAAYFVPWDSAHIRQSGLEAFMMLQEYAREHVLTCLIPAFFIAGAISVFVSQASVLKYFGAKAKKVLSYSVASVSGTVLAVCSCTVLPLFAGIYSRGAGIGPATAFLYSGPAINVLAIALTARILGWELGLARAVGAIVFAVITGLLMAFIFRKDDAARATGDIYLPEEEGKGRSLAQEALFMLTLVLILVFAAFAKPAEGETGLWQIIFSAKWFLTAGLLVILGFMLKAWFVKDERVEWVQSSWGFMKQIFPLLGAGVLVAGFMLGRPGHPALIPERVDTSRFGRQLAVGQPVRLGGRCADVLCHPDRDTHIAGTHRRRYGQGPGPGPAVGGPGAQSAQHAGDRRGDGLEKNGSFQRNHCGSCPQSQV
jgi:uncharacterized membrane protein YraQ (UPF0718 family)